MPLTLQMIWNQLPVTSTGSEKVSDRFSLTWKSLAPLLGVLAVSVGALSISVSKWTSTSAAMLSAGASWSVTLAATMVSVQLSLKSSAVAGVSVKVVEPPLTLSPMLPALLQLSVKAPAVAVTGSEKVTLSVLFTGMSVSPSAGSVALTVGGLSTGAPNVCPLLQAPNVAVADAFHVNSP